MFGKNTLATTLTQSNALVTLSNAIETPCLSIAAIRKQNMFDKNTLAANFSHSNAFVTLTPYCSNSLSSSCLPIETIILETKYEKCIYLCNQLHP